MQNSQNKKKLQLFLLVLVAILTLSIGYASITAINSIININGSVSAVQENFKVYFTDSTITEGTGTSSIDENDATIGYFDITGLSKVGDYAITSYTVLNDSNGIGADISLQLINSNSEYFKVTERIEDTQLQAGDDTTATVKVECIKTPIDDNATTSVTAKLIVNPIENESAIENEPDQIPCPFESDSWQTIQTNIRNNNTSQYNLGDIKTVRIDGKNYKLKLVNKSTSQNCGNSNYSETACGFVVEFTEVIRNMQMNNISSNLGGYNASFIIDYLNNDLYNQLPKDMRDVISNTTVISGCGKKGPDNHIAYNQKLYLISGVEIFGSDSSDYALYTSKQLDYYYNIVNAGLDIKEYTKKKLNNTYDIWWLRNANIETSGYFRVVFTDGKLDNRGSSNNLGVSPAFRII